MLKRNKIDAWNVQLKRAYARRTAADGVRVSIDRLWPRRIKKVNAAIDQWVKNIAPSTTLRRWFGHDRGRWRDFRRRYAMEVRERPTQLSKLRALARRAPITLVYSAGDEVHNGVVVLRDLILDRKTHRKFKTTAPVS